MNRTFPTSGPLPAGTPLDDPRILGPTLNPLDVRHRLARQLAGQHYGCIAEIGTWRGVSAALLAQFAEHVVTIDVCAQPQVAQVIDYLGLQERVTAIVLPDDLAKKMLLSDLVFDAAYVDGAHDFDGVALDFAYTRRCGNVLFDDCASPGVSRLLGEIAGDGHVSTSPPFAWWRASA